MAEHPQAAVGPAQAAHPQTSGAATYEQGGQDYLAQRRLQKSAGCVLLWVLGVGAVAMVAYFVVHSRNKSVARAPEEEAALLGAAQAELSH